MRKSMGLLLLFSTIFSCRTATPQDSDAILKAEFGENGVPPDWGNISVSTDDNQTNEAMLANAVARRLNLAAVLNQMIDGFPDGSQMNDAIVSVPSKLLGSSVVPFGDGQSNASIAWTGWPKDLRDVPVIGTMIFWQVDDQAHKALIIEAHQVMIAATLSSPLPETIFVEISTPDVEPINLPMALDEQRNVYRAALFAEEISADLQAKPHYPVAIAPIPTWLSGLIDGQSWSQIRLRFSHEQSSDARYWPLLFRFPAQGAEQALATLPTDQRQFISGSSIAAAPYSSSDSQAVSALNQWYGDGETVNTQYYPDGEGVHHEFPHGQDGHHHHDHTATGGVDTYVRNEKPGGMEILYTCFDARNSENEYQWGVPSGAGWHAIGHPTVGETIVNTLETSGIFAGWGVYQPIPSASSAPYEATDIATFRVLRAGEAFSTQQGHLHWYAVDASHKVCTIIWKHGCKPNSDFDLGCSEG